MQVLGGGEKLARGISLKLCGGSKLIHFPPHAYCVPWYIQHSTPVLLGSTKHVIVPQPFVLQKQRRYL